MDRLIYTAMTGAGHTLSRQAAVAHNLANVSTTGYRAEEHRARAVQVNPQADPRTLKTRAFAADASTYSDLTPGTMQYTGRTLDVAVQGNGWIAVTTADGSEAYTRAGSLELSVNGVLQTRNGLPVAADGGQLSIPPESKVSIGKDGIVSIVPESGAQNNVSTIGRIKLVDPPAGDMERGADGLFRMKDRSAAPVAEQVALAEGYLEGSNVNAVDQMVAMISLARQFELQMKMVSTADQNDRAATQILSAQ
jgi:flagellar basal-body rod protein FlgF